MANTYVDYTATAGQTDFAFSFPYLEDSHVVVEVEGVDQTLTTNYTIETSPAQKIVLSSPTTAIAGGELVRIKRVSAPDENLVDFVNGSVLTETELDRAYLHNRYLAEEAYDGVNAGLGEVEGSTNYNANNKQIKNLADGTLATDAVNKGYVDTQIALSDTNLAGFSKSTHTGNAVDNVFTLSFTPQTTEAEAYIVSIDGLVQVPDTDYTIGATAITFNTIPANSAEICVVATAAASVATVNEAQVTATGSSQARSLADRFGDVVNVLDYIPSDKHAGIKAGTNIDDLSAYFQSAIGTSKRVIIPKGTYHLNANINSKTILEGEGSQSTILKPYDDASAIFVYTFTAQQNPVYRFWDYHSEVLNIKFTYKTTQKSGVGFAFGTADAETDSTNAQYANNVKFKSCYFEYLNKGVAFNHGNIGSEFYSCGFSSNKYGVYMLDYKYTLSSMHAGNKYFFGGEMSQNECAIYINNVTDGFGAVAFNNVIFEQNHISSYVLTNRTYVPITWYGCWYEKNGAQHPSSLGNVTIDSWTGTTRSDQTLAVRNLIFKGSNYRAVFRDSFFTDCLVSGGSISVLADNCRVEDTSGFGGLPCEVTTSDSTIEVISPESDGGFLKTENVITEGKPHTHNITINNNLTDGTSRWFLAKPRSSKISSYGPSLANATTFETQVDLGGAFTLAGTVVSDGLIYGSCNQYSKTSFGTAAYVRVDSPSASIATTAGYYVFTLDFKRTLGNPLVSIWDRTSAYAHLNMKAPTLNKWYTFAGIAYSPSPQGLFLDLKGDGGDCTWLMSAYQIHRFDTLTQAQGFLESGAYVES